MRGGGGVATALLTALLAACGGDAPEGAGAPVLADPPAAEAPPPLTFDPGVVVPGDTVGGLVVAAKDVQRVFDDSVWAGSVDFEGELILQGVYQPHPDWPAATALCFHVTDPASIARIPAFVPDGWTGADGKAWFCFENAEPALALLGPPQPPRELVVAVDDYRLWRVFSDGYSTARLVDLLQAGPASTPTLTEP